jgi:hypothetical protein
MPIRAAALVISLLAIGAAPPETPVGSAGPSSAASPTSGDVSTSCSSGRLLPVAFPDQPSVLPNEAGDYCPSDCQPPPADGPRHQHAWPEIWGFIGVRVFFEGTQLGPNGFTFNPLFTLDTDFNLSILPNKKLYIFIDTGFWGQKAGNGVTNPTQGSFDFSKREFDFSGGIAWNYWGPMEFRFFGYADNNLNRGISPTLPYGYNDGVGVENRLYLPGVDPYDVGRLSFLSIGYLPSNALMGLDGDQFKPGLLLHGYLTCDVPVIRSYLYVDGQYLGESGFRPRLLLLDGGLAVRPFSGLQNLEFRLGGADTFDVHVRRGLGLGYLGVRVQF